MAKSIEQAIAEIKGEQQNLTKLENEYQTVKDRVSKIWDEYFPLAERKKSLNEQRKAARAALKAKIEQNAELKALLETIS